jgi:hypothetical protein
MTTDASGMADLALRMKQAAAAFLSSLTEEQRAVTVGPFDRDEQTQWTYLPGHRPGIRVRELGPEQRRLASALLVSSYSPRGASDAERVVRTEAIRSGQAIDTEATSLLSSYDDPQYYLRVLGDVGQDDAPWMWRLSGHHLVAQATVVGDVVAATPQFFGTQPARVLNGPYAGFRGLPEEEDLARQLVGLLGEDQQRLAILSTTAPADIQSRDDPIAAIPYGGRGLPHARMDTEQRRLFVELIGLYLHRASGPVADRAWDDVRQAGLDRATFSWAGGLLPGQGHYYAVAGPTVLLEYDNTQEGANHVHSVWRDLRHDWAGDLLGSHYRQHRHGDRGPNGG